MLSLRLLTVSAALAAAAALPVPPITGDEPAPAPTTAAPALTSTAAAPTTTAAPAPAADAGPELKPDFGFEIKSRQSQSGSSSGGASVSSTGASQGSVATTLDLSTDGFRLDLGSVGNSGVSGSGVSLGDGGFQQKTQTESEAGSEGTKRGRVITGTKGKSLSRGNAGTAQKAGANVGFQGTQAVRFTQPQDNLAVSVDKKAGASSSSGHQSATKGSGSIGVENVGGTELRRVNPAPDPTNPDDSLSSDSQLRQKGKTTGTSSLTASGATQGGGGSKFNLWSPNFNNSRDFAGNTNVAGNGIASGNGFFVQGVQANTELVSTEAGLKVKTGIRGAGTTGGNAGLVQKAGANGKASDVAIVTLADGSKQVQLVNTQKTTAVTSSGLGASSKGDGRFIVNDKRETEARVKPIDLSSEALKVPAPGDKDNSKYIDQYIPSKTEPQPGPKPKPEPEPKPKPEPEPEPKSKPEPEPEPKPKPDPTPKDGKGEPA